MTTHLYCVMPQARRAAIPPGLSGLAGARVRALPVHGLVAWVSDVERNVPSSIVEGVRAHDAVVEAALETGSTPVPARFGQRFQDDAACRAALANRAGPVESLLADMQGLVEMTLIIAPSTRRMVRELEPVLPDMVDPGSEGVGRRYLETLRRREATTAAIKRAMDELAEALGDAVADLARRSSVHDTITPLPLRTISHLISRDDVANYESAVETVRTGGEFRFLVVGPRAPYSFSALSDSGGRHGMNLAD
jgi:Gas vesicle synthesis protein GvpL/GvpF.